MCGPHYNAWRKQHGPRCSIGECDDAAHCKGLCGRHYTRWKKHGDPHKVAFVRGDDERRFWAYVDGIGSEGCWTWSGPSKHHGYGHLQIGKKMVLAHRYSYELAKGEIPRGLELDHLCRNTSCVRPDHLEPVTHRENMLRGRSDSAKNARKTHCKRGHSFSGDNLYTWKHTRQCRTCVNVRHRADYHRKRASS